MIPSDNLKIDYNTHMAICLDCDNVANVLPHYCPQKCWWISTDYDNDWRMMLLFSPECSMEELIKSLNLL